MRRGENKKKIEILHRKKEINNIVVWVQWVKIVVCRLVVLGARPVKVIWHMTYEYCGLGQLG